MTDRSSSVITQNLVPLADVHADKSRVYLAPKVVPADRFRQVSDLIEGKVLDRPVRPA